MRTLDKGPPRPSWENCALWKETRRFRVQGQDGKIHVLIEMTKDKELHSVVGRKCRIRPTSFYFLLDDSDVVALSDGTFMKQTTREILVPV